MSSSFLCSINFRLKLNRTWSKSTNLSFTLEICLNDKLVDFDHVLLSLTEHGQNQLICHLHSKYVIFLVRMDIALKLNKVEI